MPTVTSRLPGIVALFGLLLILTGQASAEPAPADPCSEKCTHQDLFIFSTNLRCLLFADPTCTLCNGTPSGRCIDFTGPGLPYCNNNGPTTFRTYPDGSCQPKCTLPFKGSSQSTQGLPPLSKAIDTMKQQCQVTAAAN